MKAALVAVLRRTEADVAAVDALMRDQRCGQLLVRFTSWTGVNVCGPSASCGGRFGKCAGSRQQFATAQTARAVGRRLGRRLDRTAIALALVQPHDRAVLAGQHRIERIERTALDHGDAADAEQGSSGHNLFGCGAAAGEQQQDQQVSHSDSIRPAGKPMVCIALPACGRAAMVRRAAGPAISSESRETTWSTFSTRSMRNYAPNAHSNC